jgi:2-hydroxychromene-2-carboxylate isomerase
VKQEPGFGPIAPYEEQSNVRFLCRTAVASADIGKGWEYLNEVMRLLWNGQKIHWDQDNLKSVRAAIEAAGISADLIADVEANGDKYDEMIQKNMDLQETNDCHHVGVPCFVFRNEPFFGQDRIDMLIWRLKQYGLTEREDYVPSLRGKDLV